MRKDSDHEQRSIILPASVLDILKELQPGALKVLIYMCSRYEGQPFAASIPTVTDATGIQRRSIVSALNTLREHQLITCISGSGNQPNQYGIPLPKRQETAAPPPDDETIPSPGLTQATPPAATPTRAITPKQITAPLSTKADQATPHPQTPTQPTVLELIAICYRPLATEESVQLKRAYPDEVVLCKKLERFKHNGDSVATYLKVDFFIRALEQFT